MGSVLKVTGVIITGGMLAMAPATPSTAARTRVVKVPCSAAALAAAITAANASAGTVLRLAAGCTYSVVIPATAGTALPDITRDVTLVGGPRTSIRRDPAAATPFRILNVAAGATLRVAGLAILNGRTAGLGGGIQNAGTVVLRQVTLAGNAAGNGGGLANIAGATATISRSLINANTTTAVGGGGIINLGTLTVIGTVFSVNIAPINGGGVNTQPGGVTRLIQTTVAHNTSGGVGGGLSDLGTTSLVRTVVQANRGSSGGGIATGNTDVTLSRSVVRNNVSDNCSPLNTIPGCVG
jgi:hypothetical protein